MKDLLKSKKNILIIVALVILVVLGGFIYFKFLKNANNEISFDYLIEIVDKRGEDLDWKDFRKYQANTTQDALIYKVYDVEGDYILTLSGKSLDNPPWVFKLEDTRNGEYIDLISGDIISFLGDDY